MSKASKLCQVVCHMTRIDEKKVFKLLYGYYGSKDNCHKQNQRSIRKKVFVIQSEKLMTSFFALQVLTFYASYKKTNYIFGILRKFWTRNMCFLCINIDLKIWPNLDLTLNLPPSKVKLDDVIGSNDSHHRDLRAKWPWKHVSHGMFVTFIL